MSYQDQVLEDVLEQLLRIRELTDAVHERYRNRPEQAFNECQYAYAAGRCRSIAEAAIALIERHRKRRK